MLFYLLMEFLIDMCVVFMQEIRNKAQMIAQKNTTPHRLSRGGYELLERTILQEKLNKRQTKSGSVEPMSPPSPPDRCDLWTLARTKPNGEMTYEPSLQVSERIVSSQVHVIFSVV